MDMQAHLRARIVTRLDAQREAVLETKTIDALLPVLHRRAHRLVPNRSTREKLAPAVRSFVRNVIVHFAESGELDEFVLTNILTALATADLHGPVRSGEGHGAVEDYSTFVRRPNPTDPAADRCYVIGREGRLTDRACPLRALEENGGELALLPRPQLHMFRAFHHARSLDPSRSAPKIPVEGLQGLVPKAVTTDRILEEAFLDVCFSDGAWELYQRRLAA